MCEGVYGCACVCEGVCVRVCVSSSGLRGFEGFSVDIGGASINIVLKRLSSFCPFEV